MLVNRCVPAIVLLPAYDKLKPVYVYWAKWSVLLGLVSL
jgi:hypothetical protein